MILNKFTYNEEEHLGYYDGRLIPSITQLLEIEYPMVNVNEELLKSSAEYGSNVHLDIENIVNGELPATEEGCMYQALCNAYKLKQIGSEELVFIIDIKTEEPIAYGHLDAIMLSTEDTIFANNGDTILCDFKTCNTINRKKVEKQCNLYNLARKQTYGLEVDKLCCMQLKDKDNKAKIYRLNRWELEQVYSYCLTLKEKWQERAKNEH